MFSYARALTYLLATALLSSPFLPLPSAEAAESASASFRNTRSDVNTGGRRKTGTGYRLDSSVGSLSLTTATSASYLGRDGLMAGYHYPSAVTDLWASSTASTTQVYLQWTTPGNDGFELSTPGAYVVRYSSIAADSPSGSDAKFNAATVVAPVPAAQVKGSRLTMTVSGLMGGVTYYFAVKTAERDGTRSGLSIGATAQTLPPYGCAVVRHVHKTNGPYTTIQDGVDALPDNLPGYACVIINDAATYNEQVTVRNFTNNGSSISIFTDPTVGARAVVAPNNATSTAAFIIANASVNVMGIDIAPAAAASYGIFASSSYVRISSVNVLDALGRIGYGGIEISSWSAISYSSVTAKASGIILRSSIWSTVTRSSASVSSPGQQGLSLTVGSSSNSVTDSFFSATVYGVMLQSAHNNSILRSTATGGNIGLWLYAAHDNAVQAYVSGSTGLFVDGALRNSVTNSTINATGLGISMVSGARDNVIARSSVTALGSLPAISFLGVSSNTLSDLYVAGSTAVVVQASTGTTIRSSVLVATHASGDAVWLGAGSVNLAIASSTMLSPAGGRGVVLSTGNAGTVAIGSVTVSGSGRGLEISTQTAGFVLSVDSITFRGLASGATAIHFLGGTFVSTITLANFEDATSGANVSGKALDLASRVTMRAFYGPRAGPDYENDPNSLVDWADIYPPTDVALWFVGMSSAALTYTPVGAGGYTVQASTRADFGGGVTVSSTVFGTQDRLTVTPLMPNTTYFLRAGALWSGTTVYAQTVITTATLSKLVTGTTVYNIHLTSMVVNWHPLALAPPDASSMSAQGYVLQASSMASFSPLWSSSVTPNVALSTLTIDSLRGGVTYYFRVGSLNHNNVPHFAGAVSTLMPVQLGVDLTTHTISVPGLVNMNTAVLITTSVIVTNTGNVKETYWVRATTLTASSPWRIGATPGADRYVLSMLINGVEPAAGDFGVGEDELDDVEKACTAAVFAFGGDCVQLPVGATRTLWFKLHTPLVTSTAASQDIRIYVRAVRDPDPDPNP